MSASKNFKVLIIEDEPDILELVKETLSDDRYELLEASDGIKALELARKWPVDLIFLDLLLPKLNGYEVCRQLKANAKTSHIPILILTAFGQKGEIEEGFKAKADGYIVKPFEPAKLREQARRYLHQA